MLNQDNNKEHQPMGRLVHQTRWWFPVVVAMMPLSAVAMEAMSENEMSGVAGRDGLSATMQANNIQANELKWAMDEGTGDAGSQILEGAALQGVDVDGANPGLNDFTASAQLDTGTNGTDTGISLRSEWDRTRFRVDDIRHGETTANSLGTLVLDSSGEFDVFNNGGNLFNVTGNSAGVRLALNNANIFYRQADDDEVGLTGLDFYFAFGDGTIGVADDGLKISADQADFDLNFNLSYRTNPATPFVTSSDMTEMLFYGWQGGFRNFDVTLAGGGLGNTEGLHLDFRTDFSSDFTWLAGEARGTVIHFQDYRNMDYATDGGSSIRGFKLPDVTLDFVPAGAGDATSGDDFVCFGERGADRGACNTLDYAEVLDFEAQAPAFATIIRDGALQAYPSRVLLEEGGCDPTVAGDCDSFNWGLITTFGNVDSDVYLYPGGDGTNTGLHADLFYSSQSGPRSEWATNTHVMIADTDPDANLGIGFINSDLLATAENLYFSVGNTFTDVIAADETGDDGLRNGLRFASNNFRFKLDAIIGGGDLTDLSNPVEISDWDFDLRGGLDFAVFPAPESGETYVGYAANMDIRSPSGGASYLSLAEPTRPDVELKLDEIDGELNVGNGRIAITPSADSVDGIPRLTFAHDIRVAEGNDLRVGNVEFAGNSLGEIAVPEGNQWHARLTLKPQEIQ